MESHGGSCIPGENLVRGTARMIMALMRARNLRVLAFTSVALFAAALCRAQQVTVTADHPDGVYEVGQAISFRVEAKPGDNPAPESVTYTLKKGGRTEVGKGTVALTNGSGT